MLLVIECMITCIIFAVIVLSTQYKDPVKYIMSYPPEIRKRVESLPEYKNSIKRTEKKHILKKLIAVFVHVFILFLAVNLFDVIVLDIGVFCHSKKLRIAGTEDMDKEYKNYLFHVKGGIKGIILGVVISLLSSCIIYIVSII